jgi:microcystin-dependent protein
MSEQYIGEIRIFPITFAPQDWLDCNGQYVPIAQYQELFTVIGSTYGSLQQNGTYFALPNLSGRAPVGMGQGPGLLINYQLGSNVGASSLTISLGELAAHNHLFNVKDATNPGDLVSQPSTTTWFDRPTTHNSSTGKYTIQPAYTSSPVDSTMDSRTIQAQIGATTELAHENRQPYQVFRFCIATNGVYPVRAEDL